MTEDRALPIPAALGAAPAGDSGTWPDGVGGEWVYRSGSVGVTRWTCRDGPARRAVEKVQQQIVDIVRKLEDAGEITVHQNEEAEEFIQ